MSGQLLAIPVVDSRAAALLLHSKKDLFANVVNWDTDLPDAMIAPSVEWLKFWCGTLEVSPT